MKNNNSNFAQQQNLSNSKLKEIHSCPKTVVKSEVFVLHTSFSSDWR